MKKLTTFVLILIALSANSHQTIKCYHVFGKIKIDNHCWHLSDHQPSSEGGFYYSCIAMITHHYLMEKLTEKEYTSLPEIELKLDQKPGSSPENEISITDSTLTIKVTSSTELAANTLKMVDYALQNLKKYKVYLSIQKQFERLFLPKELRDDFPYLDFELDDKTVRKIFQSPLDKKMKACLSKTYYRGKNKTILNNNRDRYNTIYTFRNDSFFIHCGGVDLYYLQHVERLLYSQQLGYFIFDTDNSFYYFNPSDVYKAKEELEKYDRNRYYRSNNPDYYMHRGRMQQSGFCSEVSKRHEIDIKHLWWLKIEEENVVDNRILMTYEYDYKGDSTFQKNFIPVSKQRENSCI